MVMQFYHPSNYFLFILNIWKFFVCLVEMNPYYGYFLDLIIKLTYNGIENNLNKVNFYPKKSKSKLFIEEDTLYKVNFV